MKLEEIIKNLKKKNKVKQVQGLNALIELVDLIRNERGDLKEILQKDNSKEIIAAIGKLEKTFEGIKPPDYNKLVEAVANVKIAPQVNVTVDYLKNVEKLLNELKREQSKHEDVDIEKILKELQKPKNAIAVRLTKKDEDEFYNAILSVIGGGGGGVGSGPAVKQYDEGEEPAKITGIASLLESLTNNNRMVPFQGHELENSNVLAVEIMDGDGNQIGSFGGGVQFQVNAPLGDTPTGTLAIAIRDDILSALTPVQGDAIGLRVGSVGALWTEDVNSAAILADTAAMDANLAAIKIAVEASQVSLDIMDDWDEANRAKVNLIVGSAGITGGPGSVVASTPRFTLAADDPAVAHLATIAGWDNGNGDGASISGDIAHGSPDAGEPVKIGHKTVVHGTNPTAVGVGDRSDAYANRAGIPWMIGGHPNIVSREYRATGAQTNDAIIDSVSVGTIIVITAIDVTADNANSVDVGVRIGFGSSTVPSEPSDGNSVDGMVLSHPGIPPGSGKVKGTGAGVVGMGGSGEELRITSEVPTGGSIKVEVSFYTIEL